MFNLNGMNLVPKGGNPMDVSQQSHHTKESLSRRMFLKVLGWLTVTGFFTKITGVAHSQEKPVRELCCDRI